MTSRAPRLSASNERILVGIIPDVQHPFVGQILRQAKIWELLHSTGSPQPGLGNSRQYFDSLERVGFASICCFTISEIDLAKAIFYRGNLDSQSGIHCVRPDFPPKSPACVASASLQSPCPFSSQGAKGLRR